MQSVIAALLGGSLAAASALPANVTRRQASTFNWGSVGDSFTSGVAYDQASTYDNNADNCLRTNEAWSAQLEQDDTWTADPQNSLFRGCSGSILVDIHGYGQQGLMLIDKLDNSPQVVFMSSGGNNAHFGEIVENCIFQPYSSTTFRFGVDYGLPYDQDPDCTGACCNSLTTWQNYINDPNGIAKDLLNTINDVMTTPQANSHDPFFLYIMGYAHFFNTDTVGDDTCDDWTFAPWWVSQPPTLKQSLRQRMNDLVEDLNTAYQNVINSWLDVNTAAPNQYVTYVSITESFNGHRFCEAGVPLAQQWSSPDVWFWNLQYTNTQDAASTQEQGARDGATEDDAANISTELSEQSSGSGNGDLGLGWMRRTFHPKFQGHTAIKDAFIFKMRASGMPGVIGDP